MQSHEEEAIDGVVLDKAERKRRKLLAKARRKRLKENPHNLDWGSSRMKRSALGKCLNRAAACGRSAGRAAYDRARGRKKVKVQYDPTGGGSPRSESSESTRRSESSRGARPSLAQTLRGLQGQHACVKFNACGCRRPEADPTRRSTESTCGAATITPRRCCSDCSCWRRPPPG